MGHKQLPPRTQKRFATLWGELGYLCGKIHYWCYVRKDKFSAKRYLKRLERVLQKLPDNDLAIIRQEGLALLHELKGEAAAAIKHRQREIQLMEKLYEDVEASGYDDNTRAYVLNGRGPTVLRQRQAILEALKAGQNSDTSAPRPALAVRAAR